MEVEFISEVKDFTLKDKDKLRIWIRSAIENEGKELNYIDIIIVNKEKIKEINKKYLYHQYPTDVIAFNKSFLNTISGEIYICIDVVRENSIEYSNNSFDNELNRVIIHGVLHLFGYDDINKEQKMIMRKKEDELLSYLEVL